VFLETNRLKRPLLLENTSISRRTA